MSKGNKATFICWYTDTTSAKTALIRITWLIKIIYPNKIVIFWNFAISFRGIKQKTVGQVQDF